MGGGTGPERIGHTQIVVIVTAKVTVFTDRYPPRQPDGSSGPRGADQVRPPWRLAAHQGSGVGGVYDLAGTVTDVGESGCLGQGARPWNESAHNLPLGHP